MAEMQFEEIRNLQEKGINQWIQKNKKALNNNLEKNWDYWVIRDQVGSLGRRIKYDLTVYGDVIKKGIPYFIGGKMVGAAAGNTLSSMSLFENMVNTTYLTFLGGWIGLLGTYFDQKRELSDDLYSKSL